MAIKISTKVRNKLAVKNPPVTHDEIQQCFANRTGDFLFDDRADHLSDPPTRWFISETDYGRRLKIAFIFFEESGDIVIRTAYDPNVDEIQIYNRLGR